jgi:inosine-uridine nucleoside N-ribohydrolase
LNKNNQDKSDERSPVGETRLKVALLTVALFLTGFSIHAAEPSRLVIFDNDFSGPASTNLQAAAFLLNSPNVKTLGLTVVTGDAWRDEEVAHTLRLLEIIGRTDVPVVPGAVFPLINTKAKQQAWQKSFGIIRWKGAWNDPKEGFFPNSKPHGPFEVPPLDEGEAAIKPSAEIAAEFLIRQVRRYPHQVTIVAAGPLTNLALAIKLDPEFAASAKELIFMGGLIGGGLSKVTGNSDFGSDFNLLFDPEAAEIVLTASWPKITAVGDIANRTLFNDELITKITQKKTPLTEYIAKYADRGVPLWDELTIGIFLDPTLVTRETAVDMDVDLDHGPAYGTARIWSDSVAPHLGERKVNIVQEIDVNRFVNQFITAMQVTPN